MRSLTRWKTHCPPLLSRIYGLLLCLLACALLFTQPAAAQDRPPQVPAGFQLVDSTPAVQLYRKDYPAGNPDFVQLVNLEQGAAIRLLHGAITERRSGQGDYGGDDPRFRSRSLQSYWDELSAAFDNIFCVTNGQFFYMPEYPTRLPFPLKVDGVVLSDGYASEQFVGKQLMLEIWPDRVDIRELSPTALYASTAPDILAGLAEDASKRLRSYTGRTFTGVADLDQDGIQETFLVFNSRTARQSDAAAVLRAFGAHKVMMLDGGGSTQLICKDAALIHSERLIPQALAILGAQESRLQNAENASAGLGPLQQDLDPQVTSVASGVYPAPGENVSSDGLQPGDQPESPVSAQTAGALATFHNTSHPSPLFQPKDALLVPLLMMPVFLVLIFVVANFRSAHRWIDF